MQLLDIYIYPIKSLGGIRVEEANLEERGLQYDRRWMLVDNQGDFLSQRKHPKMAMIQTNLSNNKIEVFLKNHVEENITIPFEPLSQEMIPVSIWDDEVIGQVVDRKINQWFSDILGFSCNLVHMPTSTERKVSSKYAAKNESVSFADGMPYLLIGQASLNDLNNRLENPVPMDRFRPNLVLSGGHAFEEDDWDKVKVGDAVFKITKPCARCVMTTVDQTTGKKSKEPLKTLSTYREIEGKVLFGQNMSLLEGNKIKIGDYISAYKK
ncbi:MOSC domain-containing protein [Aquiflexum sp.]|uniref:MOSC domain-containing protein n=1 Tax=Aquiflexum sp. TaxID=1872584 RepID=UPI003593A3C0